MLTSLRAAVFVALFIFGWAGSLVAQDVALTSRDGKIELSGTLLGFDGEFYRIDTEYGELTVDGSGVQCSGPGCPNLESYVAELQLSGSATMGQVLMPALIDSFAARSGYRARREDEEDDRFTYLLEDEKTGKTVGIFMFHASNTDEGFADLLADEADIVMSLREMRPEERQRAREAGMGDMTGLNRSRVLALDAVVPVVSASSPVKSISPVTLAEIFSGKITNWNSLGGPDAPIDLHLPDDSSGLAQAITNQVLGPVDLELAKGITRHALPVDLATAVAADTFSLGITSYA